jgi:hypothetical protein
LTVCGESKGEAEGIVNRPANVLPARQHWRWNITLVFVNNGT